MNQFPPAASSGGDEENLRRFLEEVFGGQLPPEALQGIDLSELAQQANLPSDPNQLKAAAAQMQHMFDAGGDGPVNWTLAQDLARRLAAGQTPLPGAEQATGSPGDPNPSAQQISTLQEAAHVAALWLAPTTQLDVPAATLEVWSRGTWVHKTQPRWQRTAEPVAKYMAGAIGDALAAQIEQAPVAMPGMDPRAMMEKMGGTMFGVQFGQAIGSLAREVLGATDLSLPLGPDGVPAVVGANVEDLIAEHELDAPAARIFLAAREIAHATLFKNVQWLGPQLFGAIEDYARGITLDLDALDEMVRDMDLSDPEAMAKVQPDGMFVFARRASQERALEELATTLALVESWVDHVVASALDGKLPQLDAMREVLRRRRATGSPAEQMLAQVVGIELRPRRVREALAWWESVLATEGVAGRDRIWDHPDLLPGVDVLSGTPQAPRAGGEAPAEGEDVALPADFDAELEKLLAGAGAEDAPKEDEVGGIAQSSPGDEGDAGGSGEDDGTGE
ncbi:MAG: zinc-dependent metalloprotease, partial [Brachybacterium sp.]|nr:zinc-dependent metalloprotease [Brachybacterium sp.]